MDAAEPFGVDQDAGDDERGAGQQTRQRRPGAQLPPVYGDQKTWT